MKLEEAFEKYSDNQRLIRKSYPQLIAKIYKGFTISWLKKTKHHVDEFKDMPLVVSQQQIDDINADDWEVVDEI